MTRADHFLWILAEECAEVAQRASKAARFSLDEIQPGQEYSNAERIMHEYADLVGTMNQMIVDGTLKYPKDWDARVQAKGPRIEQFLKRSAEHGRLDTPLHRSMCGDDIDLGPCLCAEPKPVVYPGNNEFRRTIYCKYCLLDIKT